MQSVCDIVIMVVVHMIVIVNIGIIINVCTVILAASLMGASSRMAYILAYLPIDGCQVIWAYGICVAFDGNICCWHIFCSIIVK